MRNPQAQLHYFAALRGWPLGKCVACGERNARVNQTGTCVDCLYEAAGGTTAAPEPETKTVPCKVRKAPCVTPKVIHLGPGGA